MSTVIYNHWTDEYSSNRIAHIDNDGKVYDHWINESSSNIVGRVDSDGLVYNHWGSTSLTDCVGHVGSDGVIYNHWSSESVSNAVGHVRSGIVYNHWKDEYSDNRIGHCTGNLTHAGGAALLLLLANQAGGSSSYGDTPISGMGTSHSGSASDSRYRQIKYNQYAANPKIKAAAEAYAQERAKKATTFALIFFAIVILWGVRGSDFGTAVLTGLIFGAVLALPVTLFIRSRTHKDSFAQKVWELGEQGYGNEPVNPPQPRKQPAAPPKPTPQPKPVPKEELQPAPATKIVVCPHCGTQCAIPAQKGTFQITCPNPPCNTPFICEI